MRVRDDWTWPVSGARVEATWTLPDGSTQNVSTASGHGGLAVFEVKKARRGTYTLTIDNVSLNGYTFDPGNSLLSASIMKPKQGRVSPLERLGTLSSPFSMRKSPLKSAAHRSFGTAVGSCLRPAWKPRFSDPRRLPDSRVALALKIAGPWSTPGMQAIRLLLWVVRGSIVEQILGRQSTKQITQLQVVAIRTTSLCRHVVGSTPRKGERGSPDRHDELGAFAEPTTQNERLVVSPVGQVNSA